MTTLQLASTREACWLSQFEGKHLQSIRPIRHDTPVPSIGVSFTDGTEYLVEIKQGVYFEACLINTLRRAQPVYDVIIERTNHDTVVEVRAQTFPMFELRAVNRTLPVGNFPFRLSQGGVTLDD